MAPFGPGNIYSVRPDGRWYGHPFPHPSTKFQLPHLILYQYWMIMRRLLRPLISCAILNKYTADILHSITANGVQGETFEPFPMKPPKYSCQMMSGLFLVMTVMFLNFCAL
jgi:hypothetical protein